MLNRSRSQSRLFARANDSAIDSRFWRSKPCPIPSTAAMGGLNENFSETSSATKKGRGGGATAEPSAGGKRGHAPSHDARPSPVGTQNEDIAGSPGGEPAECGREPQYQLPAPATAAGEPTLPL